MWWVKQNEYDENKNWTAKNDKYLTKTAEQIMV